MNKNKDGFERYLDSLQEQCKGFQAEFKGKAQQAEEMQFRLMIGVIAIVLSFFLF